MKFPACARLGWAPKLALLCANLLPSKVARGEQAAVQGKAAASLSNPGVAAAETPARQPATRARQSWSLQHPFEVGIFVGAMFPPKDHSLRDGSWQLPYDDYDDVALDLGGRLGLYPIRWVGAEGELAAMPTQTASGRSATVYAYRAHFVLQLPTRWVTPFGLLGAGRLGVVSDYLGDDTDRALHFGGGAKVPLSNHFRLRLDVRDTISHRQSSSHPQHWPEVLLGAAYTFGIKSKQSPQPLPPPPPPDTDGDGVLDQVDRCPQVAAQTADGCPPEPVDSDADGFADATDACPRVAGEPPDGCPNLDSDADGVALPQDTCPEQAGVPPDGCPPKDADGDGIPIPNDQCPEVPETVNGYQDADGCADQLPDAVREFTGVIHGIVFEFGQAKVSRSSHATLDRAVTVLSDYPELRLLITGHTDSVGSRERNLALSLERANEVRNYLIRAGIQSDRLELGGAGPDEPIADNRTTAGRRENRRIEFTIVE